MLFKRKPDRHVVIIGNGIAGVTTARALRKRDKKCRITIVSGESEHFYSRPALMYIYMGHMRYQDTKPYEDWRWKKLKIELRKGWVTHIETSDKRIDFDGGESLNYDQLVLATGSVSNKFGWPGQDLKRVGGLYSLQDLEELERITPDIKQAVIVGGGLIGIELAEMLHSRGKHVIILAREDAYWTNAMPLEEALMVGEVIKEAGIDLRLGEELAEIHDDGQGRACAITTKGGERIECQYVGLTAGVSPNLSAIKSSDIKTGRGILCDRSFKTHTEDVYTVGDCAEIEEPGDARNTLEQLWYTGKMHGEVLAAVLCGEEATYDRGIWFNSAKFVDLEWHTYGEVPPAGRPAPEGTEQVYWEDKSTKRSFRLVHRDGKVIGVNAMGIRYRHKVCERWIAEGRDLEYVLANLSEGNFDPEFYKHYEPQIAGALQNELREQLR